MNKHVALLATVIVLVATGCGGGGDERPSVPQRGSGGSTVFVEMVDIDFQPSDIEVRSGETVRFLFTNTGRVLHDAFVGDRDAQVDHEREMRGGNGDHHDGEGGAVAVEPGGTAELTHTFAEPGTIEIGCHQPGHYALGMKIEVKVT